MNELRCDTAQELLPDLALGGLAEDEASRLRLHLEGCAECRETWALVSLLHAGRPRTPPGLAERVEASTRVRRASATRPWWGAAAAAVAALALGIGVIADREAAPGDVPAFVADGGTATLWLADDGVIAGAPTLGDLSDEALLTLLEEMGAGPSGGAA